MCRPKSQGGRRCAKHSLSAEALAARNERRRAAYAAKMQTEGESWRDEGFLHPRLIRRGIGEDTEELDNLAAIGQAWRDSLSVEEDRAVSQYTMGGYVYINSLLRHGEEGYRKTLAEEGTWRPHEYDHAQGLHTQWISDLDTAFEKHPKLSANRILYRSIKTGNMLAKDWAAERFSLGGEITFPEFVSTSMDSDFSFYYATRRNNPENCLVLEIKTEDGVILHEKSRPHSYSIQDDEREILLNRGSKFKVVGIHEDVKFEASRDRRHWHEGQRVKLTVVQLVQVHDE